LLRESKKKMSESPKNELQNQMFEGKRAAFVVLGQEMTFKRSEVLQQHFRELGGKVLKKGLCKITNFYDFLRAVNDMNSSKILEKLDFIFTSRCFDSKGHTQKLSGEKLTNALHLNNVAKFFKGKIPLVLSPEWLSECLRQRSLVPNESYIIEVDVPSKYHCGQDD
jgi:hypothetical protein